MKQSWLIKNEKRSRTEIVLIIKEEGIVLRMRRSWDKTVLRFWKILLSRETETILEKIVLVYKGKEMRRSWKKIEWNDLD